MSFIIETTPDNYQYTNQEHGTCKIGQNKLRRTLVLLFVSYNPCQIGANFL